MTLLRSALILGLIAFVVAAIGLTILVGSKADATPQGSVALIIGNGAYESNFGRLNAPRYDALSLTAELKKRGFETISVVDGDKTAMRLALRQFGNRLRLRPTAVALFFFAGRAVEGDGENWLLPVGYSSAGKIRDSGLPLSLVSSEMDSARVLAKLIVVDPYMPRMGALAASGGLRPTAVADDTLMAFGTAPHSAHTTADAQRSQGLFTAALLSELAQPDSIERVFLRVAARVKLVSSKSQIPWLRSTLLRHVYFDGTLRPAFSRGSAGEDDEERQWSAMGPAPSADELERFVKRFPKGAHAEEAWHKLLEIYGRDSGRADSVGSSSSASARDAASLSAQPRIALVIGNADYNMDGRIGDQGSADSEYWDDLHNPINDANVVGDALANIGFNVQRRKDLTRTQFVKVIRDFGKQIETAGPDALVVVYYAGHSFHYGGMNYLVPVGAPLPPDEDLSTVQPATSNTVLAGIAVPLATLLEQYRDPSTKGLFLLLLDGCRSNPWHWAVGERGSQNSKLTGWGEESDLDRQLHRTVVAFSTAPGQKAHDRDRINQDNSPYAGSLVKWIGRQPVSVRDMLDNVSLDVWSSTQKQQSPTIANMPWIGGTCLGKCLIQPDQTAEMQMQNSLPPQAATQVLPPAKSITGSERAQ